MAWLVVMAVIWSIRPNWEIRGGMSGSPAHSIRPDLAWPRKSKPPASLSGPLDPKAETPTYISRGLNGRRSA